MAMIARAAAPGLAIDFAGSIAETERLVRCHKRYRLVLLDSLLPDTNGFSGYLHLQFALADTPIILMAAVCDLGIAATALSLGAAGFLCKTEPVDDLVAALRDIMSGGRVFPPELKTCTIGGTMRDRIATLSVAQRRVLFALADGKLNKQIAGQLDVTEATVKAHLSAIFRKLGVHNRMQAILTLQPLLGSSDIAKRG